MRKGVFRNFAKFTGKQLCQSIFFNKVAGLRHATLLKKETLAQVFSFEFYEISKNTFYTEHLSVTASIHSVMLLLMCLLQQSFLQTRKIIVILHSAPCKTVHFASFLYFLYSGHLNVFLISKTVHFEVP